MQAFAQHLSQLQSATANLRHVGSSTSLQSLQQQQQVAVDEIREAVSAALQCCFTLVSSKGGES